jgi:carbon monoxide dehydrogenase subunit G
MEAAEAAEMEDYDFVIGASRTIARSPQEVFALLSDLRRHWPLLGADLVDAGLVDGTDEDSAELILRGPVPGIERHVITRVTYSHPDTSFGGEATAGPTRAAIDWQLSPDGGGATLVEFNVGIEPGGVRDRLLVAAAKPWLQRRCGQVLKRLERELDSDRA